MWVIAGVISFAFIVSAWTAPIRKASTLISVLTDYVATHVF